MLAIRSLDGKITLRTLELEILLADIYSVCRNEREVNWVFGELGSMVECLGKERIEEIEAE